MKKALTALSLIAISTFYSFSHAQPKVWIIEGVNMNAVPWAKFCPAVKPVELVTGAGSCSIAHPASYRHKAWDGFGMSAREPKPNCARFETEFKRLTSPRLNTSPGTRVRDRWGYCINAFMKALKERAREPERFSEPFDSWRNRYFGRYLHQER